MKDCGKDNNRSCKSYRKSIALRLKDFIRKFLKTVGIGGCVYRVCQWIWRAYAIPRRRKCLQKHGAETIGRMHQVLTKNNVPYFCDYGTLLGFIREQGFIKHDDDIDISIQDATVRPALVLKCFMDAGYGFVHAFRYDEESRFLEFTVADVNGITIDVFFSKMLDGGKRYASEPVWDPNVKYPAENANSLKQRIVTAASGLKPFKIAGVETVVPENYEEVLESEYGTWRIPDAHFSADSDRTRRVLPGYAYRMTKEEALSFK